jgi:succinate dehydrogenase / fumarate reductase, flavoprotein subunit
MHRATDILNRETGSNPYLVHEALQKIMGDGVGIVRNAEDLDMAITKLEEIKSEINNVKADGASQYNPGWHAALDLRNLVIVSEAVARAAHIRQESRGGHTRTDYEGERPEWGNVNIVVRQTDSGMEARQERRAAPPAELAAIAHATLDELEGKSHG